MSNMAKFQEEMRRQRENPDTCRAGLKWDEDEDKKVIEKLDKGVSMDDIAKELKRTVNSIKTRVAMNALKIVEEDGNDMNDTLKRFKLTEDDIKEYKSKKEKIYSNNILNKNIPNPTIKDVYLLLKEIGAKMNAIESKLNDKKDV
jgi:hypothetical protein